MGPSSFTVGVAALCLAAAAAVVAGIGRRRRRRRCDREFWQPLLAPLVPLRGADLLHAVERLCRQPQAHPLRGEVRLRPPEVLVHLSAGPDGPAPPPRVAANPEPEAALPSGSVRSCRSPEQIAEDAFWLDLLVPLVEMDAAEADAALTALAAEPQIHPLEGLRAFDRQTLRERLEWARLTDVRKVYQRWEVPSVRTPRAAASAPRPGPRASR